MLIRSAILALITLFSCIGPVAASDDAADDKKALASFMQSDVVARFHESAFGYAIFPTIAKGGIGIGGARGKGRVYRNGKRTGEVTMTQLSIGLQLGGQAYRQVIFFQDERAFNEFTSGSFEFGAQAEAIAITASAGAQLGTEGTSTSANEKQSNANYHKGVFVFTMGKGGLMYQAALGGQKYEYKPDN
ncbi:MAG: YSC84-related protein [Gammaproteobacteria bacterium]|nr:YSC84-related protein [Gammaproteobacteria bacterium]